MSKIKYNLANIDNEYENKIVITGADKDIYNASWSAEEITVEKEILEVDFGTVEKKISKGDKWDYELAAASGVLAGSLSILWGETLDLEKAHEFGGEKLEKVVIYVAKARGCKKDDLKSCINYLEDLYKLASDSVTDKFGGGLQHHLRDFSHHPTIVGLIFSIISQLSGYAIGTDTEGRLLIQELPKNAFRGSNFEEKLLYGVIYWAFHLISDIAGSSSNPGKGTGIPGVLLSFLKEISSLPLVRNLKISYKEKEITFSQWISKLFNGTYFRNEDGKPIRFDLRTEIGLGFQLLKQTKPIIVNECIVRSFYFLRHLFNEIENNNVTSIEELSSLDPQKFLPYNSRALTRMLTISNGIFVMINTGTVTTKAIVKNKGDKLGTTKDILYNINYTGIARFVIAVSKDSRYIAEDVQDAYNAYKQHHEKQKIQKDQQLLTDYKFLRLNERQSKILFSLESQIVLYDIRHTVKNQERIKKTQWHTRWKSNVARSVSKSVEEIFIEDEDLIYSYIQFEQTSDYERNWLSLIVLELSLFKAYSSLGTEDEKEFKKLKMTCSYLDKRFYEKQSFITKQETETLMNYFAAYESKLSGRKKKMLIGAAGALVIGATTGGFAYAYAPELAVLLAGNAFAGLYGAALTNASLALVGGGALAVGGFGMAGGTMVLTGGGALIGLAGSSTISLASVLSQMPEEYCLLECSKVLAISQYMFERSNDKWSTNISIIRKQLREAMQDVEFDLTKPENGKNKKKLQAGLNYFKKTCSELDGFIAKNNNKIW